MNLKTIREAMRYNWDETAGIVPCKAPCARGVETVYDMIVQLEKELRQEKARLLTARDLEGQHPMTMLIIDAKIALIERILGGEH